MKLLALVISFLRVGLVKSLGQASGILGDTITLRSGADPSWTLLKIEWSIFSNNTWIATYRNGRISTERVPRYKGRLGFNTSSGDLTIRNLTTNDDMEYTVYLLSSHDEDRVNKIKLTVRQPLQTPTIQTVTRTSIEGGCLMMLNCSSPHNGTDLSWHAKPPSEKNVTWSNPDGSALLLAFVNATQNFEFTCTSSRNMENASRVVTAKCDDDKTLPTTHPVPQPQPQPEPQSRDRNLICFFTGVFVGGVITAFIILYAGGQLKAAWHHVTEKVCPLKNPA